MKKYSEALENVISKLTRMKYDQTDIRRAMDYYYMDFDNVNELESVDIHIKTNKYLLAVIQMHAQKSTIDVFRKSIELMKLELERLEGERK